MRRNAFVYIGIFILTFWILFSLFYLISHWPQKNDDEKEKNSLSLLLKTYKTQINALEQQIKKQNEESLNIFEKMRDMLKSKGSSYFTKDNLEEVIPIIVFACNRITVSKALDLLVKYRSDKEKFPIFVSQDCDHEDTSNVIKSYENEITLIRPLYTSELFVPPKERKFKGYFKIAQHYGWALNHTFLSLKYNQVIILEDDLEVSSDFYEYFTATLPLLKEDPTLWCVSAWNDNGKNNLIDLTAPDKLYRTDFFGGLGWMMTKELWTTELSHKWPSSYWDDWMRNPEQRQNRSCIRPEISRTKTFGKIGVSNGLFYDKHLKFILLNTQFVPFTQRKESLKGLLKGPYDENLEKELRSLPIVRLKDLKLGSLPQKSSVRLVYKTKNDFKKIAKFLGIMDDFKSGVPRMAYIGVVPVLYQNRRVYVVPHSSWKGYDVKW